jgi:hypothetical protein
LKRNGRLECRWQLETSADAPIADADTNAARQTAVRAGFHITVFEPSYQEREGWSGSEYCWLRAGGHSAKVEQDFCRERID